jgi:hypothetical protein
VSAEEIDREREREERDSKGTTVCVYVISAHTKLMKDVD